MWGIISTIFLGLYIFMCYYIGRSGWKYLGKDASRRNKIIYWIAFSVLVLLFPIAEMGENLLSGNAGVWIIIISWYSMITVSYIFIMILFFDLIRLIDKYIKFIPNKIREHTKAPLILSYMVTAIVILLLIYGGFNASNPVVTEYNIDIHKRAGSLKELSIAMVSDIHYGDIINIQRLNKMVKKINSLKPDIILIAGDITDGALRQGEGQKLSDILNKLQSRYGKYAVPGNHDRALRDNNSELSQKFKEANVIVLKDNYFKIEDSFYIIGRDDQGRRNGQSRKELEELMKDIDLSLPLILLDHQPVNLENAQKNKVDLQLSGHTHKGQIFPANLITGRIFEIDWGLLKREEFHLIVSSGYGTWGPPLRLGSNPEIVNIKLKFTNND